MNNYFIISYNKWKKKLFAFSSSSINAGGKQPNTTVNEESNNAINHVIIN